MNFKKTIIATALLCSLISLPLSALTRVVNLSVVNQTPDLIYYAQDNGACSLENTLNTSMMTVLRNFKKVTFYTENCAHNIGNINYTEAAGFKTNSERPYNFIPKSQDNFSIIK